MTNEIEIATVGLTEEEFLEVVRKNEEQKGTSPIMNSDAKDKDKQDPKPSTPQPPSRPLDPQDEPILGEPQGPGKGGSGGGG